MTCRKRKSKTSGVNRRIPGALATLFLPALSLSLSGCGAGTDDPAELDDEDAAFEALTDAADEGLDDLEYVGKATLAVAGEKVSLLLWTCDLTAAAPAGQALLTLRLDGQREGADPIEQPPETLFSLQIDLEDKADYRQVAVRELSNQADWRYATAVLTDAERAELKAATATVSVDGRPFDLATGNAEHYTVTKSFINISRPVSVAAEGRFNTVVRAGARAPQQPIEIEFDGDCELKWVLPVD